jgi:hypothetical protein
MNIGTGAEPALAVASNFAGGFVYMIAAAAINDSSVSQGDWYIKVSFIGSSDTGAGTGTAPISARASECLTIMPVGV